MKKPTKAEVKARKASNMASRTRYNQIRQQDAKDYRTSSIIDQIQKVKFIQHIVANADQKIQSP